MLILYVNYAFKEFVYCVFIVIKLLHFFNTNVHLLNAMHLLIYFVLKIFYKY